MDRELWTLLLSAIRRAAKRVGWHGGRRLPLYPNWLIVAMYIWTVWHDRPLCWACQRDSYSGLFRPRKLPSVSQFTRRVKSEDCQQILQMVHDRFAQRGLCCDTGYIDGKPLLVSPVNKDRQAKRGRISGGYAKGYKLHAMVNEHRRIVVWSVTGLNADEKTVAREGLLRCLPPMTDTSLILADSHYDSTPLHRDTIEPLGLCLLHPLSGQHFVGEAGHHPSTWRHMAKSRQELVQLWEQQPDMMRFMLKFRNEIERAFGVLCCTAGGLGTALPSWVRTLARVRRWVGVSRRRRPHRRTRHRLRLGLWPQ
jgi:Transposase DDE domain